VAVGEAEHALEASIGLRRAPVCRITTVCSWETGRVELQLEEGRAGVVWRDAEAGVGVAVWRARLLRVRSRITQRHTEQERGHVLITGDCAGCRAFGGEHETVGHRIAGARRRRDEPHLWLVVTDVLSAWQFEKAILAHGLRAEKMSQAG